MLSRRGPLPLLLALVGGTACGSGDVAASRAGALATQTPEAGGGETSPPRRICDKTARLTLGHRAEGGLPPQGDVGNLVEQAGYDLLYIDGNCHYWVRAGFSSLAWREVRTGLLGSEEESALATDLKWDSLPTRYGSRGTPDLGGGRRVLFDVGGVSECLGSCSGKDLAADREVGEAAHAWATRLYEKGTALEGAMRLRVSAALPTGQTAGEVYPLKLSVALTAVAASKDSPGSSLLVSDAGDVQSLRAMREALLGADGFRQLSVEEGGKAYQIAFRDALPFESENGAVPTPASKLRQLRRRTWEQPHRALARRLHAVVGKPHERRLPFESGRWLRRSGPGRPCIGVRCVCSPDRRGAHRDQRAGMRSGGHGAPPGRRRGVRRSGRPGARDRGFEVSCPMDQRFRGVAGRGRPRQAHARAALEALLSPLATHPQQV